MYNFIDSTLSSHVKEDTVQTGRHGCQEIRNSVSGAEPDFPSSMKSWVDSIVSINVSRDQIWFGKLMQTPGGFSLAGLVLVLVLGS